MRVLLNTLAVWDRLARLNMSQNELARKLRVTSGYVSQLVNGRRCPSPRLRTKLMEVLGSPSFEDVFVVLDDVLQPPMRDELGGAARKRPSEELRTPVGTRRPTHRKSNS